MILKLFILANEYVTKITLLEDTILEMSRLQSRDNYLQ